MCHYSILFINTNHVKKTITSSQQKGSIRIIGGQYRGKILHFPAIDGLRPTSDRVRETLFNWLMHDIRDARCLDLFAGSGALGFEAYSRGAKEIVFVEQAPQAYRNLKQLAASFKSASFNIVYGSAIDYIQQQSTSTKPYDIVFIDPPFAYPELLNCIQTFEHTDLLVNDGLLYLESPQEIMLSPKHWCQLKLKKAGQVTYALYQKRSEAQSIAPS